jgi:hypothetical protein
VLLEVRGLFRLWDRRAASRAGAPARDRRAIAFLAAGLALASLDSVAGLVSDFRDAPTRAASVSDPATLAALDALRDLPGGGVLCEPGIGLLVPWKAGKPVFVGHWFLSTRYAEKADVVRWFLTGPFGPEPRAEVLRQARVRWVLRGPEHTRAGPPPEVPGLGTRWSGGGWEILEFTDPAPGAPR